jgi:hypothetical protein
MAREPAVLAPLRPWNLHYGENSCLLLRTFGDPANPATFVLERLAPETPYTMMVFGGPLSSRPFGITAKAAFLPSTGRSFNDGSISETTAKKQTAIFWNAVDLLPEGEAEAGKPESRIRDLSKQAALLQLEQSAAAKITSLQIVEPSRRVTVLQTGSLAAASKMLRECNREQMTDWGLDPAVQDRIVLKAMAKRSVASLFDDSDYPVLAARAGQMSFVSARLIVGTDGNVSKCTSLTQFVGDGFKEVVCERLSQAKFDPAELADGSKVPTYVTVNVRFRMPGD